MPSRGLFGGQGAIKRLGAGDPIGDDVIVIEQGLVHHHKPAHAVPASLHGTCNDRGALQGRHDICDPAPDIVRANHTGEFIRRYSPLSGAHRAPEICPCSNNYATTRWNTSDNPTQKNVTKIGENYK